jgi:hypothetical protein
MKLTWMKWSALPAAVLMAGSVAMAQDQPPAQNATAPKEWTPTTTPTPAARPKPTPERRKGNQQTKEVAINGKTKADPAANAGKLTVPGKKPKEQNTASKNAKTPPEAKPQQ